MEVTRVVAAGIQVLWQEASLARFHRASWVDTKDLKAQWDPLVRRRTTASMAAELDRVDLSSAERAEAMTNSMVEEMAREGQAIEARVRWNTRA